MSGKIVEILIAKDRDSSMHKVTEAVLEAGKGIFGDRYYDKENKNENEELTLIELDHINTFNKEYNLSFTPSDFRRNIVINNFDLNSLVGKEFYLGNVLLKGIELCQPCAYLSKKTDSKILEGLDQKGGLRAAILKDGNISLTSQLEAV
ncbi:MAG: hypothetical protein MJK08_06340 [Campylobacterales bacterium]|nr:hypothetical protein [Campylobacterales bacterium]